MTYTPADIVCIVEESGLAHAEFCIEQSETQLGKFALREAREMLETIQTAEENIEATQ